MARYVYRFGGGNADGSIAMKDLLGGKGAGLAEMTRLGVPVPPGFTITTEVCTSWQKEGALSPAVRDEVLASLRVVEEQMGGKLGDPERPLLVSVRSGARASMPGMLDTVLNLGLNEAVVAGLAKATGDARFAWDAYRRFITMYADVVLRVPRAKLERAVDAARAEVAIAKGLDTTRLNAEELRRRVPDGDIPDEPMKRLAGTLRDLVEAETGKPFPTDAHDQLWGAVAAVFESWNNARARTYRKMRGIPESWGTACNVQAMVFGNLGDTSATGVAFTRDPSTGEARLYGEWLPNAQGEDVVAGIRTPLPIGKDTPGRAAESLEVRMPDAHAGLVKVAELLERHMRDMQDIEFTIQRGKLFVLQCRNGQRTGRAAVRIAVEMQRAGILSKEEAVLRVDPSALEPMLHPTLDPSAPKTLLARGLPASPGAATGHVVFHADEAERAAGQGKPVILVRTETSPEDVHGMKAARGVLTARGGMTSHAAVVARGMGKCCVAGCSAISVSYEQGVMTVHVEGAGGARDTVQVRAGDLITLDGSTGSVYLGAVPTQPAARTPEYDALMEWADGFRRLKVRANADNKIDAEMAHRWGAEGVGLCRTEHMFWGDERTLAVRMMILAPTTEARKAALARLLPFQREDFTLIFREMRGQPVTIRLLDPPLHEFLPHEPAQVREIAAALGVTVQDVERKNAELFEFNPMLGHRGVRLAITFPEIYAMQAQAILEAACEVAAAGIVVLPEIMIPLAMTRQELEKTRVIVDEAAEAVFAAAGRRVTYHFGTMIELPRAALRADELAQVAEFFSFGTNDLTQTTMGLSRDDAGKFLGAYVDAGILPHDPFQSIDVEGVGALVREGVTRGRATRANMKLGVCGEHGGDPKSIQFFDAVGLDYVSCSPMRVPLARLAAAQAALRGHAKSGDTA